MYTYSLFKSAVALCHLDGVDVAPRTVHAQHLTVDQSNQVLTHLTLHNTNEAKMNTILNTTGTYIWHHTHTSTCTSSSVGFHLAFGKWTGKIIHAIGIRSVHSAPQWHKLSYHVELTGVTSLAPTFSLRKVASLLMIRSSSCGVCVCVCVRMCVSVRYIDVEVSID